MLPLGIVSDNSRTPVHTVRPLATLTDEAGRDQSTYTYRAKRHISTDSHYSADGLNRSFARSSGHRRRQVSVTIRKRTISQVSAAGRSDLLKPAGLKL